MSEQVPNKKKINSKFIAILAVLIVGGGAFGFYKYQHAQVHQTTDDAQIENKYNGYHSKNSGLYQKK